MIIRCLSTSKDHEVAASAVIEAGRAQQKLSALIGRFGPHSARLEPLRRAGKYVCGLMSDLPRKSCWTLAEHAGDRTPDRMQRLQERASWNTVGVMAAVRDCVVEHLADDGLTVLVLDESGAEKTGTHTAGVKRQYVGCAGKVANAVNFVNVTYSTGPGHALVGSRLYVPVEQLVDEQREHSTMLCPGLGQQWANLKRLESSVAGLVISQGEIHRAATCNPVSSALSQKVRLERSITGRLGEGQRIIMTF